LQGSLVKGNPEPKNVGELHALLARKPGHREGEESGFVFGQLGTETADSCKAMPESALKQNQRKL